MFFLATLIAAVIFGVTLYLAMAKYQRHRLEVEKKEAEFLVAMKSGKALPQPSATSVTMAMESAIAAAKITAQLNPSQGARTGTFSPTLAPTPVPVAVAPAPPKGLGCMFCQLPVDMMANDAGKWGAKLPDAESGRFVWVHFDCLNRRLSEATRFQACLEELVATGTAIGNDIDPGLDAALQNARAALAPRAMNPGVSPG